jgi:hypothetical protein
MRATAAVEEWRSLRNPVAAVTGKPTEHWLPPAEGWLKVNTDGAFKTADSNGGGGVVIRDHHGDFLCGESHFFPHVADAEGAELMACRRGLLLAEKAQVQKLVLETDSVGVAAKLRSMDKDRSFHSPLVEEIKVLLRSFSDSSV